MDTSLNLAAAQKQDYKVEEKAETAGSVASAENATPSPLFTVETAGSVASAAPSSSSSSSFSAMA